MKTSETSDILAHLVRQYDFLFNEHGFCVIKQEFSASFGNCFVLAQSVDFKIRFVLDRGQSFVQVSSNYASENWFDLDQIEILIISEDVSRSDNQENRVPFLKDNYLKVKKLLSKSHIRNTSKQLYEIGRQKVRKMYLQSRG